MAYHFATCATDSSDTIEDMIDSNEATLEKLMHDRDAAVAKVSNKWAPHIEKATVVLGQLREDLALKRQEEGAQVMAEVKVFMGRLQATDSTWSVLKGENLSTRDCSRVLTGLGECSSTR